MEHYPRSRTALYPLKDFVCLRRQTCVGRQRMMTDEPERTVSSEWLNTYDYPWLVRLTGGSPKMSVLKCMRLRPVLHGRLSSGL